MARYNGQGEIISDDGTWRWIGGTIFDLKLEQWERIPAPYDTMQTATRPRGPRQKPGRRETREAARLALQASEEWKHLEALKANVQAQIDHLSPFQSPAAEESG